jgi:hypothetical protein
MHTTSSKKNTSTASPTSLTPAQLLGFFLQLLPHHTLRHLPALKGKRFYDRLFNPLVTLWYLLFQRLHPDHTLQAVLTDARAGGGDALQRKLSAQLLSGSTSSYSDARQRLPWQFLAQALSGQGRRITELSPTAWWKDLRIGLLDGSTVRLRPYRDIPKHFAPHGNQHPQRYWCLMRVVVHFCGLTGAALGCALGPLSCSEQALGCQILREAWGRGLFIGDRNFGVFRLAQAARQSQQEVLLRLTEVRALKLLGRALRWGDYRVTWSPTRHDQLEPACRPDPIPGRLLVVGLHRPGFRSQRLYLFTTLASGTQYPMEALVELYGRRWQVELNLRYVKTQMEAVQLEAHSADMARKEWLASLLAYNLIRAAMLCAALHQDIPPLTLSFSASRRRLEYWLRQFGRTRATAKRAWLRTLQELGQCLLPHRPRKRPNEPRAQRHLRESYPPLVGSRTQARKKLRRQSSKS